MQFSGISEHDLFAHVDYQCRIHGANHLAYPPVVAGGRRANIIHYINNNQVVESGEMVLMDAGKINRIFFVKCIAIGMRKSLPLLGRLSCVFVWK